MKCYINYLNSQYKFRLGSDVVFEKAMLPLKMNGLMNKSVSFVMNHQSKNVELWKAFVEQFRIQDDGPEQRWKGEYWGKMMRGACFIYKVTQDAELLSILKNSIQDMLLTQEPNGRFSTYSIETEFTGWDIWSRKYVMLGFLYFLEISKDEALNKNIITAIKKHADYIIDHIGNNKKDIFDTSYCWGCLQSSSILEPFIKLYALTDEKRYLDFATYIVEKGGSSSGNMIDAALDSNLIPSQYPVIKAYECMSFFEGVAEYYSVTKIEKYKKAFLNFVEKIVETEFTVVGGTGCTEELFDFSTKYQTEDREEVMQETCVTVTLLKVLIRALEMTKDSRFADKMEIAYYNCLMNSTNFNMNDELYWGKEFVSQFDMDYSPTQEWVKRIKGYTFDSYAPLYKRSRNRKTGGFNFMKDGKSYGCCACIGSLGTAILPLYSLMNYKAGVVINFYENMSGQILTPNGQTLEINMETNYPFDSKVKIKISLREKEQFDILIRIPEWSKKPTVNNKITSPGEYYKINAEWFNQEITIDFGMQLEAKEINDKIYLSKGPIVYAIDDRLDSLDKKATKTITSIKPISTPFASNESFEITFNNNESIKVVDYASSGSNWYRGENKINVFLDK